MILQNAEKELQRKKDLFHDGLLPGADLEAAQLSVDTARLGLRRENEVLQSLQQVRSQDVEVAEKNLAVARTREYARAELNRNRITAPSAGTVLEIHAYPGRPSPKMESSTWAIRATCSSKPRCTSAMFRESAWARPPPSRVRDSRARSPAKSWRSSARHRGTNSIPPTR